jgi:hypothetical protein
MRIARLDEIVRQKDPALKSAVELLATGQVSAALDALQQQGHVKEIPNAAERVRAIAKSYVESPENTLIVSPDNASRRELKAAVRQELKTTGSVAPEDHTFRVLVRRSRRSRSLRITAPIPVARTKRPPHPACVRAHHRIPSLTAPRPACSAPRHPLGTSPASADPPSPAFSSTPDASSTTPARIPRNTAAAACSRQSSPPIFPSCRTERNCACGCGRSPR